MQKGIKKILVATDFSACAENALRYSVNLAKELSASVILLRVYTLPAVTYDHQAQAVYREKIDQIRKDYFYPNDIDFDFELAFNSSAEDEIVKVAEKKGAELIVLGTHGANTIEEIFGTTTMQVIRNTRIPVLSVPEKALYKDVQKIAFACDYKKLDEIEPVASLLHFATAFDAKVSVFNVNPSTKEMPIDEAMQVFRLDRYLEDFKHSFDFADGEKVEEVIMTYLKTNHIDVLAMMPQKHSIFERLFKKSITNKLVQSSEIPILTFK